MPTLPLLTSRTLRYEIAQENKCLSEPLAHSLREVESLRTQLAAYNKDKASLAAAKARLAAAEKRVSCIRKRERKKDGEREWGGERERRRKRGRERGTQLAICF